MPVASLLDTDLYKLTMQACVHKHYSDAVVEYRLYNRSKDCKFSAEAVDFIREQVLSWSQFRFSREELDFLRKELSYLPSAYFEFLERDFKLNPATEVDIQFGGGSDLAIFVKGMWHTTIWYEVPILSTVSEAYFRFVDTDWSMEGQEELARYKAESLIKNECDFTEFGSRRRRSFETQKLVVGVLAETCRTSNRFLGTSNVHLARINNLRPVGTVAHELMMGIAAYTNRYDEANIRAMNDWIDTVGAAHAGVALTDTFGTPLYLKIFKPPYSDIYVGVRQDSGSPEQFAQIISDHYAKLGVPPHTKRIVFSDALTVERCIYLRQIAINKGLVPAFGIGTYFTNDFVHSSDGHSKSKPLNIVMKIAKVNGRAAVKLSDNSGKNTGDPEEVRRAKEQLNYSELSDSIDEGKRWG